LEIKELELKSIVESFFVYDNIKYHEICFYYYYKTNKKIKMPEEFYILSKEEIRDKNIQPKILREIINSKNKRITHYTIYE